MTISTKDLSKLTLFLTNCAKAWYPYLLDSEIEDIVGTVLYKLVRYPHRGELAALNAYAARILRTSVIDFHDARPCRPQLVLESQMTHSPGMEDTDLIEEYAGTEDPYVYIDTALVIDQHMPAATRGRSQREAMEMHLLQPVVLRGPYKPAIHKARKNLAALTGLR